MKISKNLISILAISTLCIGCENSNSTSSNSSSSNGEITNTNSVTIEIKNENKDGKVYTPDEIKISETLYSLESKKIQNYQVLPSTGDINLLVIPILLPDYQTIDLNNDGIDDKEKVIEDIEKAFFSESLEKFESVKSFYKKSSFNKLNLSGEVTEWFDLSEWTSYTSATQIDYYETYDVLDKAISWAKNILKIDMTKYDNDQDGYIDGVWCIYSSPNHKNNGPKTEYSNYWAYTNWGNQDVTPDIKNPIYNLFGWASYDFMYEEHGIDYVDAHTYIHETGHFLGLNDYYSDQLSYSPIGKIDMMDANIGDHNSYSKMLLGWTKPYVVTTNASINLKSMNNENSLIVIPSDNTTITNNEFDPFSEYILIEYYTNEGLNYNDSISGFNTIDNSGVRIYHIDNRKFLVNNEDEINITYKEYENEKITSTNRLFMPITNRRGKDNYNMYFNLDPNINLFDEIRLIESNNIDTFSNGGKQKAKTYFTNGDSFSLEKYGKNFFYNGNVFNNGDSFSSIVEIKEVK